MATTTFTKIRQLSYDNANPANGRCVVCRKPVLWLRPAGAWLGWACGVVSRDAASVIEDEGGVYVARELSNPAATRLHACVAAGVAKYQSVFDRYRSGQAPEFDLSATAATRRRFHSRGSAGASAPVPNNPSEPAEPQLSQPQPSQRARVQLRGPAAPAASMAAAASAPFASSTPLSGSAVSGSPIISGAAASQPQPQPRGVVDTSAKALLPAAALAAWKRAEDAIASGLIPRIMLWGVPGTGKTELPFRVAQANGWGFHYQLLTEETPSGDLGGMLIVQNGSTVWLDGSLGRAIRESHDRPVIYLLDEIGHGSADALSYCLLALQSPESMRVVLRNGETIQPKAENWHAVATSNDDPASMMPAVADRLHVSIKLTHPHPGLVDSLVQVESRRLACAESREYSIRSLISYDRLRQAGYSLQEAAGLVWEPEVAQSLIDAVRLQGGK